MQNRCDFLPARFHLLGSFAAMKKHQIYCLQAVCLKESIQYEYGKSVCSIRKDALRLGSLPINFAHKSPFVKFLLPYSGQYLSSLEEFIRCLFP